MLFYGIAEPIDPALSAFTEISFIQLMRTDRCLTTAEYLINHERIITARIVQDSTTNIGRYPLYKVDLLSL